jgi:hypothetical protein
MGGDDARLLEELPGARDNVLSACAKLDPAVVPVELTALVGSVRAAVHERRKKGELAPAMYYPYIRYKLSDFSYGEGGVVAHALAMERFARPDWSYAGSKIVADVHDTVEFTAAAAALARMALEADSIDTHLSNFVMRVAAALAGADVGEAELATESKRLLKLISAGPEAYGVKVELVGLVLLTPEIDLPDIVIRRPRREDFEREELDLPYRRGQVRLPLPGAIAELRPPYPNQGLHSRVARLLTMLRLFVVAGVRHRGYLIDWGPSISGGNSTSWHPGDDDAPSLTASIGEQEAARLRRFWEAVAPVLPPELYEAPPKTVNHTFVAYERYCSALERNNVFEERVANAVMGLEALFLDENQGGAYRCRLRVARAMANLGEAPRHVFDLLADAYKARNCFAHGERLSAEAAAKMKSTYGDRERIYLDTLQFLRKGLVSRILSRMPKKELIRAIDGSLVDPACAKAPGDAFQQAGAVV